MASILLSLTNTTCYEKIIPSPEESQGSSNVQISPIKKRAALPSSPDSNGPSLDSVELTTITDADDLSPETDLAETITSSRKAIYDWSLLDERDGLPRNPSAEEFHQLFKLLRKTLTVGVIGPMLRIIVQDLPAKPRPLTVAMCD